MAKINFVRKYKFYNNMQYDVIYTSGMMHCYNEDDLPKTVKEWLRDKVGIVTYHKAFKKEEIIYK